MTRRDLAGAAGAGVLVLAFFAVLLWRDPLLFWNDDYELSILPVFADVARSWSEGHLPLLSPYSWVCSNLAGEFQYGTFSVFVNAAVIAIWKFPLLFSQQAAALSLVHLFVLAMGGYMLARGRKLAAPLALMVGLVAALNGWIVCWGAIDWFGALGAFAWLPWAWWGFERALDRARGPRRFLWPVPFVYLLVTGGFPYTVLMMVVLLACLSVRSLVENRKVATLWPLAIGTALGLGIAAPAWLALFDYVHGSARAAQEAAAHFQWVVPPAALPAFLLPSWTVKWADFSTRMMPHTATEMACGLVPPVALLAGLIRLRGKLIRQIRWELGLLLLVLVISMLPSANVFRWSFRWLPFLHLILALCAAEALRAQGERLTIKKVGGSIASVFSVMNRPGALGLFLLGLAVAGTILTRTTGPFAFPLVWVLLGIALAWALLEKFAPGDWITPAVTAAAFLAAYWNIAPNCGVPKYNLDQKLTAAAPLDPQRLYLSLYPEAESTYRTEQKPGPVGLIARPGSTSMWGGVHLINGYSPIRPSGVAREFSFAIHGELQSGKDRELAKSEAGPGGLLAQLGVDGVIVASELEFDPQPASEWALVQQSEEGRVFHRRGDGLARVRSVAQLASRPHERFALAAVSQITEERNRVAADVHVPAGNAPALLTISRPYFRGYQARLGARALKVESYRGLMPTVEIPAGTDGRLIVLFRPWWLIYGGAISAVCLLTCLAIGTRGLLGRG